MLLKTGLEKGRSNKTSRRCDLLISDEKCDLLYHIETRLVHLKYISQKYQTFAEDTETFPRNFTLFVYFLIFIFTHDQLKITHNAYKNEDCE